MPTRRPSTSALLVLLGLGACSDGVATPAGQAPLRRLTPTEYNRTISDLYGFGTEDWPEHPEDEDLGSFPQTLPPDIRIHGFEGMLEGQVASPYLAERYANVARHYARFAPEAPRFWACTDRDEAACAEKSVLRFAHRAWRRQLTPDEVKRLTAAHQGFAADHGVETAVQLSVAAILSAPQFLYLAELGDSTTVDAPGASDWAMASRLSYFLWDSMPDAELFERAAFGGLSTPGAVEEQARRMLAEDRARAAVVHFHRQWLDLESVYSTRPDFEAYATRYVTELSDPEAWAEEANEPDDPFADQDLEEAWSGALVGIRAGMVREAELFVERTVFDGAGTLEALLTDHHGYVTEVQGITSASTAVIYGVQPDQVHDSHRITEQFTDGNIDYELVLRPATYPADQRAGLLTQGAVLASHAHPVHPAPVLRGKFVLEQLTCTGMGQPPDGAEAAAPPDTLDAQSTNRERLAAATGDPICAACHDTLNPVGFAFEHYDSMGGWRDTDNGSPVDASGQIQLWGADPIAFNDAVELSRALAGQRRVYDCYAENWTRYALGRELRPTEEPDLVAIQDAFWATRGDVQELLVSIVTSPLFLTQTPSETPEN